MYIAFTILFEGALLVKFSLKLMYVVPHCGADQGCTINQGNKALANTLFKLLVFVYQ